MQQKEIFKKVGSIIMEITEQYQYLSENPERQNGLELELFSANADFLAEHVKVLKKFVNISSVQAALPVAVELQPVHEGTSSMDLRFDEEKQLVPEVNDSDAGQHSDRLATIQEEVVDATFVDNVQHVAHKMPVDTISVALPHVESSTQPEERAVEAASNYNAPVLPVIEDIVPSSSETESEARVTVPLRTLNDIISEQKRAAVQEALSATATPISDLKTAINLNDKLLFIKDLFNGYSLAYSEAVDLLNRFDSMEGAEAFLNANYAAKNNWAAKQNTVDKFYEILRRRYLR